LILEGVKVTQNNVAERSGLSIATVKRYYKKIPIDLNEYVKELNTYQAISKVKKYIVEYEYFIHPECPSWVFRQDETRLR
jgi:quinolinate synthase